jgi:peptidoglycan/LPS O-acetylase OafA/YrhL
MSLANPTHPRLAYMPGLDGLRALAVGAVLLYHHDPRLLTGGFLGVELFFVLSGYLITALLSFEWQAVGRISLADFWLRRARRLLPAVLVLLAVCMAFTTLFMRERLAQLRDDALASLFYVANWHLILDERPYFESFERPSLLLHLWSLAVEEQFYLLWPPLLALGLWRLGQRPMLIITLVCALGSTVLMAVLAAPDGDVSRAYYGTDTRASGLLIGSALALVWPPYLLRTRTVRLFQPWRDQLGLLALSLLAVILFVTHEFQPWLYRGGFLLVDLATAAAIMAVARPGAPVCQTLLGIAPLRWVGERSYSIYLWHWPVFVLTRPGLDVPLSGLPLFMARLAITLILAELSYRLVELPVRRGAIEHAWRRLWLARGPHRAGLALRWLVAAGLVAGLALWIGAEAANAPPPPPPEYAAVIERAQSGAVMPPGEAAVIPGPGLAESLATSGGLLVTPPNVVPQGSPQLAPPLPVTPITAAPKPVPAATDARTPIAPPQAAAGPATTRDPRSGSPPPSLTLASGPALAIGDSIMLGAAQTLGEVVPGIEVDAAVSRQIGETIALLQARRSEGRLAEIVVVHLGNNGYTSPERVEELLGVLSDVPRVVLINTAVPRSWEGPNNAAMAAAAQRFPNTVLLDWRSASTGRYELFWSDGVHLRPEGAQFFATLIAEVVGQRN